MKKLIIIVIISLIGISIYDELTTPEVYVNTEYYDGYVIDDYFCGKHSTTFVDTKTNKEITFWHGSYMSGKYKADKGDHIQLTQIKTKKTDYRYTYKLVYNGKEINTNYWVINNLQINN